MTTHAPALTDVAPDIDDRTATALARADATQGNGPEAFGAVLEATLAAAAVGAAVAAPYATRLWFTPWRFDAGDRVRDREAAWLQGVRPHRLRAAGRDLAAFDTGTGPTVLLVHGWGDSAARLGAFVHPLRARGLRVLGVDLPGHGGSGADPTDLYELTDVVQALIEEQAVEAVVAHSLGGQAAIKALRHATRVRAAAILAPAVSLDLSVATFQAMFALPDAAVLGLRDEITRRYGEGVWAEFDARGDVAHLDVPALVVHSDDDDRVHRADVADLAARWSSAQLTARSGLGHTKVLRDPQVVADVVDFVGRQLDQERS